MASPTSHPYPQKQPAASHLTPVSAASPPAPPSSHSGTNRSVPSPAYSAALKASNRPLHHRNGSAQIPNGSTPRAGPSTNTPRPGTTSAADSPAATAAAAMLMDGQFGFPAGGGIGSGFTPRGVGLTPVAMQMTASQGGISAIAAAWDQEEERKRRVESIVGMVSTRLGFVSQAGVERCARRLGLECLWEESMGEERKRILTIAGHGVLVDVEFRGEEVRGVVLQFEGSNESVVAGAGAASRVLKQNLRGETYSEYVLLDRFFGNLERLASMDRLGGAEVNCFDAVEGIHRSLERVYAWEIGKSKHKTSEEAAMEVMCQHSGNPKMHTRGRVGLALQYWMDRRFASGKTIAVGAMEIDGIEEATDEDDSIPWSAIIECEALPAELYPPIRISDAWVSDTAEKPAPAGVSDIPPDPSPIDWQEPTPTLLSTKSPTNGLGGLDIEDALIPKAPDVHFVAKFEPPVIVPLQTAIQVHASVNSPLPQDSLLPTTYESLLFADLDAQNALQTSPRSIENITISYDPIIGISTPYTHKTAISIQPTDYARAISHLPFSHPRQIIALLPTLRQWALTASIFHRSFISSPLNDTSTSTPSTNINNHQPPPTNPTFQTLDAELADFMSTPLPLSNTTASTTASSDSTRQINITLSTSPPSSPHFHIHFPNPSYGGKLASVSFKIGLNGTIEAVDVDDGRPSPFRTENGDVMGDGGGEEEASAREKIRMREKVRRVLQVGESIGVCVEWIIRAGATASATAEGS